MKLNKECVNKILNLVVENTQFSDKDIINQKNFDSDTFLPNREADIFISDIIKECSEFSPEEIKTALFLLENGKLITLYQNKDGRIECISLTSYSYAKLLENLLNPSDKCN